MGHAQAVTIINAPVETVWNCLNDIDHTPEWVMGLEDAELKSSGPYGVGTLYIDYNKLGPLPQITPWRITEFEPMTRQTHVSKSTVLPSTMSLNLNAAPEGTQVEMIVEYRFLPRLGLFSRALEAALMNRLLNMALKQNLASLNTYLTTRQNSVQQPAGSQA